MNLFSIYAAMPVAVQNALCTLKGYQLNRLRYGGEYARLYEQLQAAEKASAAEIRGYKEEHIHDVLTFAYRHCPYYRTVFRKAGVTPADFRQLDDLRKFPKLTKEQVRQNWIGMIADNVDARQLIPYHTSGSTGKALDFYWTRHNLRFYWATVWRGRQRCGVNLGDRHLNFTGKLVVPLSQTTPPPIGGKMERLISI